MSNYADSATTGEPRSEAQQDRASPAADTSAAAEAARPPFSIFDGLGAAFASVRQVVLDFLELLSLEVRHAGLTLMWMIAWGAVATVLIVAAWIGFMAALALWAVSLGLPWITAVIGIAFANVLAAAVILGGCMKMSRNLLFTVTRRQLAAIARRAG